MIKKYQHSCNTLDRYEPEINRCTDDLANHYGTVIDAARARNDWK